MCPATALLAAKVEEVSIAVPDISAATMLSEAGMVDVLRERQSLKKECVADGLHVRWIVFKAAGPVINEPLANGPVDVTSLDDLPALVGEANGLDTRLLSATARDIQQYLALVPGLSLKALKSKPVGLFRGTVAQLWFDAQGAAAGLKESGYKRATSISVPAMLGWPPPARRHLNRRRVGRPAKQRLG